MAEPRAKRWTVADVEALPYDEWRRYEIIDGELFVSTAPHFEHQSSCTRSATALSVWNDRTRLGRVFVGPGLVFSQYDAVQPDVVWISRERIARFADASGHFSGPPELVIEVLSPGTQNTRRDRQVKLALYARRGVDEYWIVDWRHQTADIYRGPGLPRLDVLNAADTLTTPLLPGFALLLATVFAHLP